VYWVLQAASKRQTMPGIQPAMWNPSGTERIPNPMSTFMLLKMVCSGVDFVGTASEASGASGTVFASGDRTRARR